jgi:chromosome segregation ATPase
MARTGVTIEDVMEAVETLEKKGDRVTQLSVRRALGDRGSMSTIRDHLRELRSRMAIDRQSAQEVPSELKDTIESSMGALWEQAQSLARQDVEEIRKAAQARVELAERELEEMGRVFDEQCERLNEAETALKDLELRISATDESRVAIEAEKAEIVRVNKALLERLDTQADAIKHLTKQIQSLETSGVRRVTRSSKKVQR